MKIVNFEIKHVKEAEQLALENYNEEREIVTILPKVEALPDLTGFAKNGLGVAAYEKDKMVGFLCCYEAFDNAFGTPAKGTFSPIHAHAATKDNRSSILKRMYQEAADKWVKQRIYYHSIAFYAHDTVSKNTMFEYGFGLRCIDAIRGMNTFECNSLLNGITFKELAKGEAKDIRVLRRLLYEHMGKSPCLMNLPEKCEKWIERKEESESRLFVARDGQRIVSFIEIADEGENFVTEVKSMVNICGAFSMPEYRGTGLSQSLINYAIKILKSQGYELLGVDYEGFNPTANGFWKKHFTIYTNSVVRRIDECALHE